MARVTSRTRDEKASIRHRGAPALAREESRHEQRAAGDRLHRGCARCRHGGRKLQEPCGASPERERVAVVSRVHRLSRQRCRPHAPGTSGPSAEDHRSSRRHLGRSTEDGQSPSWATSSRPARRPPGVGAASGTPSSRRYGYRRGDRSPDCSGRSPCCCLSRQSLRSARSIPEEV